MSRRQAIVRVRGRTLSLVDFTGVGPMVLALHGSFGRGTVFATLADRLRAAVRMVALDQRGHGLAEAAGTVSRSGDRLQ